MHPNPAFRQSPRAADLAFARAVGFGPLIAHIPFLIDDAGTSVDLHLARSNPFLRLLDTARPAVIAVNGPHAYVSPDWYGVPDQVPTWNYVAVHLRGTLTRLDPEAMRDMLDRQSAAMEAPLAPKRPWTADKMSDGVMERMMRAITPCRLTLTDVRGTWKLNQNKPDDVRLAAADHVATATTGSDPAALAALMRAAGTA